MRLLLPPLITCILTGRTDAFCVTEHQEITERNSHDGQLYTSNIDAAQFFTDSIRNSSILWNMFCLITL